MINFFIFNINGYGLRRGRFVRSKGGREKVGADCLRLLERAMGGALMQMLVWIIVWDFYLNKGQFCEDEMDGFRRKGRMESFVGCGRLWNDN